MRQGQGSSLIPPFFEVITRMQHRCIVITKGGKMRQTQRSTGSVVDQAVAAWHDTVTTSRLRVSSRTLGSETSDLAANFLFMDMTDMQTMSRFSRVSVVRPALRRMDRWFSLKGALDSAWQHSQPHSRRRTQSIFYSSLIYFYFPCASS